MNAQLKTKIVYWLDTRSGQLTMGLPESFPAPPFYEKIVCGTAREAETYSRRMREQEHSRESMVDEQREEIEGELIRNLRGHMFNQMANARNAKNRDFLRIFLERQESAVNKTKMKRESYLHSEAFEHGH
jgi:hypothetical protein